MRFPPCSKLRPPYLHHAERVHSFALILLCTYVPPSFWSLSTLILPPANHTRCHRSSFEEVLTWEEADAVLVTPVRHTGEPAICPLVGTPRSQGGNLATSDSEEGDDENEGGKDEGEGLSSEEQGESDDGSTSTEGSAERSSAVAADVVDEDTGVGAVQPSFVYQRRKFVLRRAASGPAIADGQNEKGDGEEEQKKKDGARGVGAADEDAEETFGLVELPIGWPLGRWVASSVHRADLSLQSPDRR